MVDLCRRPARRAASLLQLVLLTSSPTFADGIFRLGSVQQLSVTSAGQASFPVVACAESGSFVAAWLEPDADLSGVFARTFAWGGAPTSAELPVNAVTTDSQDAPSVARDAAGNFVVLWRDWTAEGGSNGIGIRGRRFTAAGAGATEFSVNSHLPGNQEFPDVAQRADGSFVAAWRGVGPGSVQGAWFRRYDAAGTPQGTETLVAVGGQSPSVALNPLTGGFVIAWNFYDGTDNDVYAQRYDNVGNPLGAVLNVNTSTSGDQFAPTVASDADGDFVVTFVGEGQGDTMGVLGRLFSAAGSPVGNEFWVNATVANDQFSPSAAFDDSGGFLVIWTHTESPSPLRWRTYAAYFSPLAVRFGLSDYPVTAALGANDRQATGEVCRDGARSFRAVFDEYHPVGASGEIYSQRLFFGIFADGFESNNSAAWSLTAP